METCANCDRPIGKLEARHPHATGVVCTECQQRLANEGRGATLYYGASGPDTGGGATASLVLGIIGMVGWIIPLIGFPITIIGIVYGARGRNSSSPGKARAGLILSIIGLVLTTINSAIGAYLGFMRAAGRV